ncbi:MAG: GNAT family N-acetyltransferase [Gemmatimonadetes bacterium]|jgi:acyl-CoA hydrolase/GNAT superfamily N-acetyltransferase|nr:GNAT family N-acetyltransferase [Gemmatimonadota bacterium]
MRFNPEWRTQYQSKLTTADHAVDDIKRGQRVFIGSGAAEPQALVAALAARGDYLADNQLIHIRSLGVAPYTESKFSEKFRYNTFFIGDNVRGAVSEGRADYTPIFLSEVPHLFRQGKAPIDVALIQITPPDEHGFCSYGVSVDIVKAATESAKLVVAEINPRMPRTLGDSFIHIDRIDQLIENETPIFEFPVVPADDVARRIGRHIAELVEDGSTIQMGIGTIPDSVLHELHGHKDLGVHTEMVSDGIIQLIEKGVVNGSRKSLHRGKVVTSFALGTQQLYDFLDDNPLFEFYPNEYSNDPFVISRNKRMVAVNAALEIDLTGQVCSDSLGTYFYSGIGGQVDFIRGAARSEGGKPVIAMPSTAIVDGQRVSRITSMLKQGAGVVTSRGDVHYVVTEFGAVDLHGKSIRERALGLIHIAHPDFREELMEAARQRHFVYSDQVVVPGAGMEELEELETDFIAENGVDVHFRPIEPTDEPLIQDLFYRCSEQTIYLRFFSYLKAMPHSRAQHLVAVDYDNSLALVGTVQEGQREVIIAVGRYSRDPATNYAECAFLVRDDWQDKGVGRYLIERLMEVARGSGIVGFTADVLIQNTRMLHVFHLCAPGPVQSRIEEGSYHLTFSLYEPEEEAETPKGT